MRNPAAAPAGRQHRWLVVTGIVLLAALGSASTGSYVVRRGDTLSGIAAAHGVTTAALAQANGISNPNRVVEGRTLTIPGSVAATRTHQVARGDTLIEIARTYGVSAATLAAQNGITNPNRIVIGRVLTVSGGGSAASAPAASAAAHVVRRGENLSTIASRYGTTASELAKANDISNPNRLREGVTLRIPAGVTGGGGSALPARLRGSPERLALLPVFDRWAAHYGVPGDLLKAMTWLESGWQNSVVSVDGAIGIGQLLPSTVDWMEETLIGGDLDPFDPDDNIRMAARYLRWLLAQTGGDAATSLAGYYQGLRSVRTIGLYDDTKAYVAGVLSFRRNFA